MRIVKDTTFEFGFVVTQLRPPRHSLTVVARGTFVLVPDAPCALAPAQTPVGGDVHHDDDEAKSLRFEMDLAPLKPRGECLLAGTCHAPRGAAAPVSGVAFQVGAVRRSFAVFGDRAWTRRLFRWEPSPPIPFRAMPLRWERAFGGTGYDKNPLGVGLGDVPTPEGPRRPLPNIEHPDALVTSPDDRPEPAGAFPVPRGWKARLARAGTYDAAWKRARWPWFPDDFDPAFFNAAPPAQQIDGYWRGDEQIVLRNLRPDRELLGTRLPGLRARCLATVRERNGVDHREVALHLDTITVDADAGLVYALWRGTIEVATEDAAEVERLFLFDEPLAARSGPAEAIARMDRALAREQADVDGFAPEAPPADTDTLSSLPTTVLADDDLEHALRSAPAPALDARLAGAGLALPSVGGAGGAGGAGGGGAPPAGTPDGALADAGLGARAPAPPPDPRGEVVARLARGEGLAGEDLSGVDLSDLDLTGRDLSRAILEGARLRGARLDRATLDHASLAGADLAAASLKGASLKGADLAGASCGGADFEGAALDGAHLGGATLAGALLRGASCVGAEMAGADLSRAVCDEARFDRADLARATLTDASFARASLVDATVDGASAARAVMDGADLTRLRASSGARFERASFKGALCPGAHWDDGALDGADFSRATLGRADFTGASLVEARLDGCDLRGARFQRAKLTGASLLRVDGMEASFEAADLAHADLRGGNFHGAEFWRARVEHARLDLARLTGTRLA